MAFLCAKNPIFIAKTAPELVVGLFKALSADPLDLRLFTQKNGLFNRFIQVWCVSVPFFGAVDSIIITPSQVWGS